MALAPDLQAPSLQVPCLDLCQWVVSGVTWPCFSFGKGVSRPNWRVSGQEKRNGLYCTCDAVSGVTVVGARPRPGQGAGAAVSPPRCQPSALPA